MQKYDVVTIGDASEDIFIRPHDFRIEADRKYVSGRAVKFELGEKIPIDQAFYDIGGSACNISVSLAKQEYKIAIITATGEDTPGEKVIARLKEQNVDDSLIISKAKYQTNFAVIMNVENERTIFVCRGLKDYSELTPKSNLSTRWIFLCPLGENTEQVENKLISLASEKGVKIAWNPGSLQIEKGASEFRALLRNTSVLFLNREEAIKFANLPVRPDTNEVGRALVKLGPKVVVITDGKEGAYCIQGERSYRVESLNRERIDATGAGDSFASAFLGRLLEDDDLELSDKEVISEALKAGIINSSSVVNMIGAQKGLLSRSEIKKGIADNPRMIVEIF